MLHLPVELVISILSYVPLSTLTSLSPLSREWNEFIQSNESVLFHNAAILHGFSPSASLLYSELGTVLSQRALIGANDWKSFCHSQSRIQRSWRGEDASSVTFHRCGGSKVHRIKVDEQRGFMIVTGRRGGLLVIDLYEDRVLWSLPTTYVRAHAHCEYDAGYLIFDRSNGAGQKEVWRLAEDVDEAHPPSEFASPPDAAQRNVSLEAEQSFMSPTMRGHFRPWAVLKPPSQARAFRFVYPTLIAAAECFLCFLWDIPTGQLIQTIEDAENSPNGGGPDLIGDVNYVEVSARSDGHAFICSSRGLRVYSRVNGRCVLELLSSKYSYADNTYSFLADGSHRRGWRSDSVLKPQPTSHRIVPRPNDDRRLLDAFIAVHVSACGSHLVALLMTSRLVVVPFYKRLISGEADIRNIALDIQVGSPISASMYLAFENDRVALATGTGLFIVAVDFESALHSADPPRVTIHRAAWFNDPLALVNVSCLQMSRTGLFVNWDPSDNEENLHYEEDDLVPNPEFEEEFDMSLREEPRPLPLANGDGSISVSAVQLFEPAGPRPSSALFSIDFTPNGSSWSLS